MTIEVGTMQGRLSPPVPGRLQAFPWSSWEAEFACARTCGFDAIEWLFQAERYEENPLWEPAGRKRILEQVELTGIQVPSVCADYFMVHPFFRVSSDARARSVNVLEALIAHAHDVGIRTILIPVLESCEIRTLREMEELLDALRGPLDIATAHGVSLALETELPVGEYRALVEGADHPALGAYYDTGNAAAKGFDIAADIRQLSPHLQGVHIKDRTRGGPSVALGQGDADFAALFDALNDTGYSGPLVVQAASGPNYLGLAREYAQFVRLRFLEGVSRAR